MVTPADLAGCCVTEIGARQDSPFIGLAAATAPEVRLFIWASFEIDGVSPDFQSPQNMLAALCVLLSATVTSIREVQGSLLLKFGTGATLAVSSQVSAPTDSPGNVSAVPIGPPWLLTEVRWD